MTRPLVVVESPAKAKTIAKFLGNAYEVRASVGHVADLPKGGLAVDIENGFKPTYELTERGRDVVKDLKAALKDASELYLATDEDRESPPLLEYGKWNTNEVSTIAGHQACIVPVRLDITDLTSLDESGNSCEFHRDRLILDRFGRDGSGLPGRLGFHNP